MDKDGDLDVVTTEIGWFENTSSTTFSPKQIINNDAAMTGDVVAVDIKDYDLDGDSDIIFYADLDGENAQIKWMENLGGTINFSDSQVLVDFFPSFSRAFLKVANVDNDGDFDMVVHNGPEDVIWFENMDGAGSFSDPIFIAEYFDFPSKLELVDINHDGFLDIFWCGHPGVFWVQNNTMGGFEDLVHNLGPTATNMAVRDICFGDLDGDNDKDLLSLGYQVGTFTQKIRWYENEFPVLVLPTDEGYSEEEILFYPNPVSDVLQIKSPDFSSGEIYDMNGKLVHAFMETPVALTYLKNGLYQVIVEMKNNRLASQRIVVLK